MPSSPSRSPSSGRKIFSTPQASRCSISSGRIHPTAASEDGDVGGVQRVQELAQVQEELDVAPLVRAYGHGPCALLDCRPGDLVGEAIVAQVDDFSARLDESAAHQVDRGVMAVVERRRGDYPRGNRALRGLRGSRRLPGFHRVFRKRVQTLGQGRRPGEGPTGSPPYLMVFSSCFVPL